MTLFSDQSTTVAALRADRLVSAGAAYFPDVTLSDDYLHRAVLSAEADASRRLRVFLEPTVMVPEGTDPVVIAQYETDGTRYAEEPAYDWNPEFFRGNQWGFIPTRQRPVIAVQNFKFLYPGTQQTLYTFPIDWVRVEKKYGQIQIVPTGPTAELPLNSYVLQVFNGGRSIPHFIQIDYTAGLVDAVNNYPDLIDLIYRMAALRVLEDQFIPSSGSISIDGISQSLSTDTDKYEMIVEKRLDTLRQSIQGIRMAFI